LAALLSEPANVAMPAPLVMAALRTGWFWRLLAPGSPSPRSLFSGKPLPFWSMPRPPFEKIALPSIAVPVTFGASHTPSVPLKAIVFPCPAAVPPTVLFVEPWSKETPRPTFFTLRVPVLSVPMRFPRTTLPVVPALLIATPMFPFPEITLPAPATPIVLLAAPR
jgi:hypothetical protein